MSAPPDRVRPIVTLRPAAISVAPGAEAVIAVRVVNGGSVVAELAIDVVGAPAAWAVVDPPSVRLFPGAEAAATVRFRPPSGPSAHAGRHPVGIRVRPSDEPRASVVEEAEVEVLPAIDVTARLVPGIRAGSRGARYRLDVENRGNVELELHVAGRDPEELLQVRVAPVGAHLGPGTRASLDVRVSAAERFLRGQPVNRPFIVEGVVDGAVVATATGQLAQGPILPAWLLPAAIAIVGLGAVGMAARAGMIPGLGERNDRTALATPTVAPATPTPTLPPTPPPTAAPTVAVTPAPTPPPTDPPTEPPSLTPTVAPPTGPAEEIVASGTRTLLAGEATDLDLDAGLTGPLTGIADQDATLDIQAIPGATVGIRPYVGFVALAGPNQVGLEGCRALANALASDPIPGELLGPGTRLCLLTSDARLSELVIAESGERLVLTFTTWGLPDT